MIQIAWQICIYVNQMTHSELYISLVSTWAVVAHFARSGFSLSAVSTIKLKQNVPSNLYENDEFKSPASIDNYSESVIIMMAADFTHKQFCQKT